MTTYRMYVCDHCGKEMKQTPFIEMDLWVSTDEPTGIKLPCDKKHFHFCSFEHAATFINLTNLE